MKTNKFGRKRGQKCVAFKKLARAESGHCLQPASKMATCQEIDPFYLFKSDFFSFRFFLDLFLFFRIFGMEDLVRSYDAVGLKAYIKAETEKGYDFKFSFFRQVLNVIFWKEIQIFIFHFPHKLVIIISVWKRNAEIYILSVFSCRNVFKWLISVWKRSW